MSITVVVLLTPSSQDSSKEDANSMSAPNDDPLMSSSSRISSLGGSFFTDERLSVFSSERAVFLDEEEGSRLVACNSLVLRSLDS